MANVKKIECYDAKSFKLFVGDKVSYTAKIYVKHPNGQRYVKCITKTGTIQSMHDTWIWDNNRRVDCCDVLVRHSARSPKEDRIPSHKVLFISRGEPFSGEAIETAQLKRQEVNEEKRTHRITKIELMCYILDEYGPMTRVELMRRVHTMEGKTSEFRPTNHVDYFLPKVRHDGWCSPVTTKLIEKVGTKDRTYVYGVTDKGRKHAKRYVEWRSTNAS